MRRAVKTIAIVLAAAAVSGAMLGCKSEAQIEEQKMNRSTIEEQASYYDSRSTINVAGKGVVTMQPDIAEVGFTVYAEAADVSEAQQKNTELMDAVMEVIRAKGIADEDTETGMLRIDERYDYEKSPAKIVGYEVRYTVNVTLRDMDKLGSLISEAVAAGASEVSGPTYTLDDDSAAYLEALGLAVASANDKARVIAAGLGNGVRLVPLPISITEQGGADFAMRSIAAPEEQMNARAMKTMGDEAALNEVQTSVPKIEVTATVNGVYQIVR